MIIISLATRGGKAGSALLVMAGHTFSIGPHSISFLPPSSLKNCLLFIILRGIVVSLTSFFCQVSFIFALIRLCFGVIWTTTKRACEGLFSTVHFQMSPQVAVYQRFGNSSCVEMSVNQLFLFSRQTLYYKTFLPHAAQLKQTNTIRNRSPTVHPFENLTFPPRTVSARQIWRNIFPHKNISSVLAKMENCADNMHLFPVA